MKVVLYIVGGIAILVVASIAGCAGCMALFVGLGMREIPDHVDSSYFESRYPAEISTVVQRIDRQQDLRFEEQGFRLHDDLVAVLQAGSTAEKPWDRNYTDLYRRHTVSVEDGYSIINGAGVAGISLNGIRTNLLVREVTVGTNEYWLLFLDTFQGDTTTKDP